MKKKGSASLAVVWCRLVTGDKTLLLISGSQVRVLVRPPALSTHSTRSFYSSLYSFRSPFLPLEPSDRCLRQRRALAEIMPVEDHMNIGEAMPGDAGDFLRRRFRKRQPRDR